MFKNLLPFLPGAFIMAWAAGVDSTPLAICGLANILLVAMAGLNTTVNIITDNVVIDEKLLSAKIARFGKFKQKDD